MLNLLYPKIYVDSLLDIPLDKLHEQNITAFIIDLDNTITEWNSNEIRAEVEEWFRRINAEGLKSCILSNNGEERIRKVRWIVPGGATGQESIQNGLRAIYADCEDPRSTVVLINDGVRPLVAERIITENLECVRRNGTSVTVAPVPETIFEVDRTGKVERIPVRSRCMLAKAPQGFFLEDIVQAHSKAAAEGQLGFTNSAELMFHCGYPIFTVEDSPENIKITTPVDFYVYKSIVDTRERMQILGVSD